MRGLTDQSGSGDHSARMFPYKQIVTDQHAATTVRCLRCDGSCPDSSVCGSALLTLCVFKPSGSKRAVLTPAV